jgi:DNA-directed RNA polymerase subunit RPC12/RpoP
MYGRNGVDDCCRVVIAAAIMAYFFAVIFRQSIWSFISLVLLYYALFRMLSKNKEKRMLENQKFINYLQAFKLNFEQRKTHRIFVCNRCGKKVRVPKGKGKIEITCPLCGNRMIRRT